MYFDGRKSKTKSEYSKNIVERLNYTFQTSSKLDKP